MGSDTCVLVWVGFVLPSGEGQMLTVMKREIQSLKKSLCPWPIQGQSRISLLTRVKAEA